MSLLDVQRKESRWRSLSIMDLQLLKRGSLTQAGAEASSSASEAGAKYQDTVSVGSHGSASGGQSYELIKSTQVQTIKNKVMLV